LIFLFDRTIPLQIASAANAVGVGYSVRHFGAEQAFATLVHDDQLYAKAAHLFPQAVLVSMVREKLSHHEILAFEETRLRCLVLSSKWQRLSLQEQAWRTLRLLDLLSPESFLDGPNLLIVGPRKLPKSK